MNPTQPPYQPIIRRCEQFLDEHGDNYLGVGWTKRPEDVARRYQLMLDSVALDSLAPPAPVRLLDFGCGAGHLYEYMQAQHLLERFHYTGLDLSPRFSALVRAKHPALPLLEVDVLDPTTTLPQFDYAIFNGIFTMKMDLTFDAMWEYMQRVLERVWAVVERGVAFNVMSKQVQWERDDLFHLPFDMLADYLSSHLSRNFLIRHDYRLFEYTTYVYR